MKRILRDERGMALAVAIFALVVVGALVAGAFFAGTQEQRVAENSKRVQQSFGVADGGVAEVIRTWVPESINQRGTYPTDSVKISTAQSASGTGTFAGYIYKLNANLFLLDVTGMDRFSGTGVYRGTGARQRLGLITRVRPLQIDIQASLTTRGNVDVQGNGEVDGNDQNPTGWTDCDPASGALAGIRTTGNVTTGGNGAVYGQPPVFTDPTLGDSTFTKFGDVDYNALAARATITLSSGTYKTFPTTLNGACDKTNQLNWGDGLNQLSVCSSYFPIIHVRGDLTLNGDQGQGILLVDGNVKVQGSYEFFGIVIAQGEFSTAGGGTTEAHFWGGVMARNALLDPVGISGKATLNFSNCAIIQALQNTSVTAAMRSRGWVQLF